MAIGAALHYRLPRDCCLSSASTMKILHSAYFFSSLGCSVAFSLLSSLGLQAYGQSTNVSDGLAQLDRAICLRQWGQAIDITSGLMALPNISRGYRQELLSFRRQLQSWRAGETFPNVEGSCDRTSPLFLTLAEPDVPDPQPLDWDRALATFRDPRPIIQLDDDFEPTDNLIPSELTVNSPDVLLDESTPIDTADGFSVVGGRITRKPEVYSLLARFGDRISLEVDITRTYLGGDSQIFLFDPAGRLLAQSEPGDFQTSIRDFFIPKTDAYFVVVSAQGTTLILDGDDLILDWQSADNASFDYTLTLTGVTPYQALLP